MFNLSEIGSGTSTDFEPMPEGEYVLKLLSLELKETRNGTGKYLDFCFSVDQGFYENRRIWIKFNVVNESRGAVNFALKNLKSLFEAAQMGINSFDLDDQGSALIRLVMSKERLVKAQVVIQPENNGYKAKNDVAPYSWSPVAPAKPSTPPWAHEMRPKEPAF